MQSAKETASNVAASAKAGMEKTKATLQEKGEKMTTRDPLQKEIATEKKDERIHEAERQKLEARQQNVATRQGAAGGGTFGHDYTTGTGHPTGAGVRSDYPQTGTTGAGHTAGTGVRSDYPQGQGLAGTGTTTTTGGAERVRPKDPNVTGYGSGATY
ncbi:hypothetical protein BUALT_Bualt12G0007000 [Buddleja alternifolia]|uniref:Seed maturation protein LEA 4 n=1 Tax=Buddleja alternifolia TaxID=168488 RepID=A0AAV6WLD2_9LAMI|nr:hypothetical protein BUALT_Bualt12G0007000 [Buddleja alternifolia]